MYLDCTSAAKSATKLQLDLDRWTVLDIRVVVRVVHWWQWGSIHRDRLTKRDPPR